MSKKKSLSISQYLKISLWSIKISWNMSKLVTVGGFFTTTYNNLNGLINTFLIAKVVDVLIKLISEGSTSIEGILPYVGIIGVVQLITIAVNELDYYINRYRWRLSSSYLMQILYEKVNSLGVQTNQLPFVANKRKVADEWIWGVIDVNRSIVNIVALLVQSITAALIVFSFSTWIGIAIIGVTVISFFQSKYYVRKNFEWDSKDEHVQGRRNTWDISAALSNSETMDEVALVGAFPYLDNKIKSFYSYFNNGFIKLIRADSITGFLVNLLNLFVILVGSVRIFIMAFNKVISIGNTTFYIGAINSLFMGVSYFSSELINLNDLLIKGKEVYSFFNLKPVVDDGTTKLERLITPPSIEIKNISFHYPNSKRNIFKNFSLKIKSGEKIAIVGENGAGKSTIVKLLCRIYDPQKGEILINGINLKELSINDWYKNVGVLFQDFNFYGSLTVEENIYLGKPASELDKERVIESAKNADAHEFIMIYKKKYQTIMCERYKGGIQPSKGQQQKIAIARFFYRDAPFAIFDEPTSAIDASAEYRIFNRIYNFFDNKTVMIISHRFSTVRNADRIVVIKNGKIIEEGTHKRLIKLNRVYADNFRKQAEGYN